MAFVNLDDIPEKEIVPGFHGRFLHTEHMTMAYWRVKAGSILPEHSHVHEMTVSVQEGKLELTVGGETRVLTLGDVALIPSNVPHSGRAITDCRIIDSFSPVREDYRDA